MSASHRPALALSLLLLSVAPNSSWKQIASHPIDRSQISFRINGRILALDRSPKRIASYFRSLPADTVLLALAIRDDPPNVSRATDLRRDVVRLGEFTAVTLPHDLTWSEDPFHDGVWLWRFHNLEMLRQLLSAYLVKHETWYRDRAHEIWNDWLHDNLSPTPPSPSSWNDHATALRLQTALYWLEAIRRDRAATDFELDLLAGIYVHCEVLCDSSFYTRYTNHGLDQSYLLYLAGAALPAFTRAPLWESLGRLRTQAELAHAFAADGVHVENSPGYHFYFMQRLLKIDRLFRDYSRRPVLPAMAELVKNAMAFFTHVVTPSGLLPPVGDTEQPPLAVPSGAMAYVDTVALQNLRYSLTQGRTGTPPRNADAFFPASGYAILRDRWPAPSSYADGAYLLFRCGLRSSYHRHDDDLSVVLDAYGEDWLIDSGLYSYEEKDPIRRYVRSAAGHNVVRVVGVAPSRTPTDVGRSGLYDFAHDAGTARVAGRSELCKGIVMERRLSVVWPDSITIEDSVRADSDTVYTYQLLFHVPADKTVDVSGNTATIRSTHSAHRLRIVPLGAGLPPPTVVKGQMQPEPQGWTSYGYKRVDPTYCIIYQTRSRHFASRVRLSFE